EKGGDQHAELGIAETKVRNQPGKQRRQQQVEEVRRAMGEAHQADGAGILAQAAQVARAGNAGRCCCAGCHGSDGSQNPVGMYATEGRLLSLMCQAAVLCLAHPAAMTSAVSPPRRRATRSADSTAPASRAWQYVD